MVIQLADEGVSPRGGKAGTRVTLSGSGFGVTVYVNVPAQNVAAAQSFIDNPPDLTTIGPTIKSLADTYLTLKGCYESLPAPPMPPEADPWALLRADYISRLQAAEAVLTAAGGPV